MTAEPFQGHYITCVCGKRGFFSRKAAKHSVNQQAKRMSVYKCQHSETELWHAGHLPQPVKDGRWTRDQAGKHAKRPIPGYKPKHRKGD